MPPPYGVLSKPHKSLQAGRSLPRPSHLGTCTVSDTPKSGACSRTCQSGDLTAAHLLLAAGLPVLVKDLTAVKGLPFTEVSIMLLNLHR